MSCKLDLKAQISKLVTKTQPWPDVGNKGEVIPEFSLEITQFDFTKKRWQIWGMDQVIVLRQIMPSIVYLM